MQRLARTLLGIQVSKSSIGYSFPFDLSMVGILNSTQFGTLAHELFHLMVRNDFGDIPPWLEEGMASLYEVSGPGGNDIVGLPNWRGEILAKLSRERPSIEQLVKMDWRSFDGTVREQDLFDIPVERQRFRSQAANHATARYLMLYLQEKKKLVAVYTAFRIKTLMISKTNPNWRRYGCWSQSFRNPCRTSIKNLKVGFGTQGASKVHQGLLNEEHG